MQIYYCKSDFEQLSTTNGGPTGYYFPGVVSHVQVTDKA